MYRRRYSNTLLVSLNNRISIREVSHTRGGLLVTRPMAGGHSSSMHLELERSSYTSQERSPSGEDGIIGECCHTSFPGFLSASNLNHRYLIIWAFTSHKRTKNMTLCGGHNHPDQLFVPVLTLCYAEKVGNRMVWLPGAGSLPREGYPRSQDPHNHPKQPEEPRASCSRPPGCLTLFGTGSAQDLVTISVDAIGII